MMQDILIGLVLAKLFGKTQPAVTFQPPVQPVRETPPAAAAPMPVAVVPTPTGPIAVPAPVFPVQAAVPPSLPPRSVDQPPAGMRRAVEVWVVRPEQARLATLSTPQATALAMRLLESQFPKGWQAAPRVTAAEVAEAKSLLGQWHDGGVVFSGGSTPAALRAFRMTKHPAAAAPGAPAPTAPAAAPQAAPQAPVTAPAAAAAPTPTPAVLTVPGAAVVAPQVLPEVLITASPAPAAAITAVRRGEGLAQVAKRLGRPETATSARDLQAANVPQGPDATWSKTDLTKGGLKKSGRAGGLQPGDRLFVPAAWGAVDASRL